MEYIPLHSINIIIHVNNLLFEKGIEPGMVSPTTNVADKNAAARPVSQILNLSVIPQCFLLSHTTHMLFVVPAQ